MKRIAVAALAMIALLGFTGCDILGTKEDVKNEPSTSVSQWWIKGSFWKDWAWNEPHYFTKDNVSGALSFELTDLRQLDYEFVLVDPDGTEFQMPEGAATLVAADTATPLTAKVDGKTFNPKFAATKTSYTIVVDISNPDAPELIMQPGATAATPYDAAELAAGLTIKGGLFGFGWTDTAGVFNASTNTVTFDDITVTGKSGEFGFSSLDGFLKGVTVASPAAVGSATAVTLLTTGDNAKITDVPKTDSIYTIVVTIDTSKTIAEGKYSMVVTLKTLGTTAWAYDAWAAVYIAGDGSEFGDWTAGSFKTATIASGIATYTFTATKTPSQFKIVKANEWGTDVGFGGIEQAAGSITLSSNGGNIGFTSTVGTSYTITIDFTTTKYKADGVPAVKVVAN